MESLTCRIKDTVDHEGVQRLIIVVVGRELSIVQECPFSNPNHNQLQKVRKKCKALTVSRPVVRDVQPKLSVLRYDLLRQSVPSLSTHEASAYEPSVSTMFELIRELWTYGYPEFSPARY